VPKRKKEERTPYVRQVLETEMRALRQVSRRLNPAQVAKAVQLILDCTGRVIVTGVGKAGIIGQKISATLASTGTPSYSVHPLEAVHGDLGRILGQDVVVALSNSGETEVVQLLPYLKQVGAKVIAITGARDSTLARHCDVVLDMGKIEEACPLGLAPSASTTAMLALGDALALAVARKRKFNREEYALYHPGGELGRQLIRVEEVMRVGNCCPRVREKATVREALLRITQTEGRAGAVCVMDVRGRLVGIFTDGDLRRRLLRGGDLLNQPIRRVMTPRPKRVAEGSLATEAGRIMKEHRIDELPVVNSRGKLLGIMDIQDMLEARLIPGGGLART
jgi:arabinose-5-phosphate isomerase